MKNLRTRDHESRVSELTPPALPGLVSHRCPGATGLAGAGLGWGCAAERPQVLHGRRLESPAGFWLLEVGAQSWAWTSEGRQASPRHLLSTGEAPARSPAGTVGTNRGIRQVAPRVLQTETNLLSVSHPPRSVCVPALLFPGGRPASRDSDTEPALPFRRPCVCSSVTRVIEEVTESRGAGPRGEGTHRRVWDRAPRRDRGGSRRARTGRGARPSTWGRGTGGRPPEAEGRGARRAEAPGVRADPLVDDGHATVAVQLQLLPRGLEPHHLGQEPSQLLMFCGAKEGGRAGVAAPGRVCCAGSARAGGPAAGAAAALPAPAEARARARACRGLTGGSGRGRSRSHVPFLTASVATNTLSSWWVFMRPRIFFTAPSRLGTSSLWPQMKSFLLR